MERLGLVWQVEQDLERVISLGLLPKGGFLPSEHKLARTYGVSRSTVREALLRLCARGLVVQHPGRKSRAVALDEAVTLENLSVALHEGSPTAEARRRLLEGFFTLKRDTTVELLAACCEQASQEDLRQLEETCLALEEAARWGEQNSLARREFELLRLAALVAQRPGHFLLIQSLERSFRGMAARVVPHLDRETIAQWARYVLDALGERDAQALRRQLSALLLACDEQLLQRIAPVRPAKAVREMPPPLQPPAGDSSEPEPARSELAGAGCPNLPACPTGEVPLPPHGLAEPPSQGSSKPEPAGSALSGAGCANLPACRTAEPLLPPSSLTEPPSLASSTPGLAGGELAGAACANLLACRTALRHVPPTGRAPSAVAFMGLGQPSGYRGLGTGRFPSQSEEGGADTWSPVPWGRAPSPAGAATQAPEPAHRAQASASVSQGTATGYGLPEPACLSDSFEPCAIDGEPGTHQPPTLPPQEPREDAKMPALLAMLRWMLRWLARVPPFSTLQTERPRLRLRSFLR